MSDEYNNLPNLPYKNGKYTDQLIGNYTVTGKVKTIKFDSFQDLAKLKESNAEKDSV